MTTYAKPTVQPAWGETNQTSADMVPVPTSGAGAGMPEIPTGWPLSTTAPARQYWNWILFYVTSAIRYFSQRGLVDYDPVETYGVNARIIGDDGLTYCSLAAGNIGNLPSTSPASWVRWGLKLSDLGAYATTAWVTGLGYATTAWVGLQGFATQAWVMSRGYITYPVAVVSQPARYVNTVYQNTTGRNLLVSCCCSGHSTGYALYAGTTAALGTTLASIFTDDAGVSGTLQIFAAIPPNWYYEIAGGSIANWVETQL